jgi:carbon storage regulator CsrA
MLILKRKIGQSLLIGGQTIVKVLGTQRGVAILGIDAPVEVPVLREEAKERRAKKQEATP